MRVDSYYTGRATHVHAKVYTDWQPEGTGFTPGRLSHVGQFFFDDTINEVVDKVWFSLTLEKR